MIDNELCSDQATNDQPDVTQRRVEIAREMKAAIKAGDLQRLDQLLNYLDRYSNGRQRARATTPS